MKTFKQFLTVTLFAGFILTSLGINAQKIENIFEKQNNNDLSFFVKASSNISTEGVDNFPTLTSESRYFEKINTTITITYNQENGKIISINDSTNTLSDDLIVNIINKSNVVAASSCHCLWYDVWCRGMCALCEAGVISCDIQ